MLAEDDRFPDLGVVDDVEVLWMDDEWGRRATVVAGDSLAEDMLDAAGELARRTCLASSLTASSDAFAPLLPPLSPALALLLSRPLVASCKGEGAVAVAVAVAC